jgi:RNase P/RNase MRP subunit p29
LRQKGIDVYYLLDEWVGTRFQSEMDAIRDTLNVIKEAIEAEVKLPNEMILEGEKFKVDFNVLTYEPEPDVRPDSPVEKISNNI